MLFFMMPLYKKGLHFFSEVVMRNINLIVQKQPNMLQTDVRYFVCKYNDPLYVKLEKIAVMVRGPRSRAS